MCKISPTLGFSVLNFFSNFWLGKNALQGAAKIVAECRCNIWRNNSDVVNFADLANLIKFFPKMKHPFSFVNFGGEAPPKKW